MPRNISFFLTQEQIRNRTKTVTRRLGWKFLNAGDVLNACVKCQGLKPGETVERICQIRVVIVRRERLWTMIDNPMYGDNEAILEGFPEMDAYQFVAMFCREMKCHQDQTVTRIEFEYLEDGVSVN